MDKGTKLRFTIHNILYDIKNNINLDSYKISEKLIYLINEIYHLSITFA